MEQRDSNGVPSCVEVMGVRGEGCEKFKLAYCGGCLCGDAEVSE